MWKPHVENDRKRRKVLSSLDHLSWHLEERKVNFIFFSVTVFWGLYHLESWCKILTSPVPLCMWPRKSPSFTSQKQKVILDSFAFLISNTNNTNFYRLSPTYFKICICPPPQLINAYIHCLLLRYLHSCSCASSLVYCQSILLKKQRESHLPFLEAFSCSAFLNISNPSSSQDI